ncbi:tyrosine-type recombinase/integrase [bacterium]|nr:tyrosine-type recombinase/integrase [bacterium]
MNKANTPSNPVNKLNNTKMAKIEVKEKIGHKSGGLIADNFLKAPSMEDFFKNLPPDLEGWAGLYIKLQVEGVKAPQTVRAVRNDLSKFRNFYLDHHNDTDLRKWLHRTTQRFIDHLQEIGQRPKTVHRALITARSFARWVLSIRPDIFTLGDPTKGAKPPAQELMRPKCLSERHVKGKHLRDIKCKGNLFRDVLLGEETLRALQGYLNEERPRDEKMFDGSKSLFLPSSSRKHRNKTCGMAPRTINAIVKNIATEANKGLSEENQIQLHPHMFQHTHAYQILKKDRSLPYLQKRLGHQSMNYLALYTQMPEGEEKELLDGAEFK